MSVYIHNIATALPEFKNNQQDIREKMKSLLEVARKSSAILHRLYSQSGIESRYSVLSDFNESSGNSFFVNGTGTLHEQSTSHRNDMYAKKVKPLFLEVGEKLLEDSPHISKEDITHVITVSCTGFYAPGPDIELVQGLGLKDSTQRFNIGFMGCYAAFPALKMADAFCKADPDAVVMIICAELCTLHFQHRTEVDHLLSASVFGDGAAGVLVSAKKSPKQSFEIQSFETTLISEGKKDMAWNIGNNGFEMILSTYVPEIIEQNIEHLIQSLLQKMKINLSDIDYWAVHPGGRSIIDKVQSALGLESHQVEASRNTLANYGNMSSATVLFVLKNLWDQQLKSNQSIIPIAFGPGLTVESALIKVHS